MRMQTAQDLKPKVNNDPWANRELGMRCISCMFYVPKSNELVGRCRRHAPTMSGYPVVFPHDWCGDHKLVVKEQ